MRAAVIATLLAASLIPPAAADPRKELVEHGVGECRVATWEAPVEPSQDATRSVHVHLGSRRAVINPAPGADVAFSRGGPADAVLLTSLDDAAVSGIVQGAAVGYPGTRIYVDRTLLDRAMSSGAAAAGTKLNALLASGRVFAVEPNVDVVPGIRFTISPASPDAFARVEVRCGDVSLLVVRGSELRRSGFARAAAAPLNQYDPARLRSIAGDRTALAPTDGDYPALLHLYRFSDGFRIGAIEAREYGGAPPRSGRVFVEVAAAKARR